MPAILDTVTCQQDGRNRVASGWELIFYNISSRIDPTLFDTDELLCQMYKRENRYSLVVWHQHHLVSELSIGPPLPRIQHTEYRSTVLDSCSTMVIGPISYWFSGRQEQEAKMAWVRGQLKQLEYAVEDLEYAAEHGLPADTTLLDPPQPTDEAEFPRRYHRTILRPEES